MTSEYTPEWVKETSVVISHACEAVYSARVDGKPKHSPESWRDEGLRAQIDHAFEHMAIIKTWKVRVPEVTEEDLLKEINHAICRLSMARWFLVGPSENIIRIDVDSHGAGEDSDGRLHR